ncbi:MAG: glycoside hydrolase family 38 C-terminal domain-containing protein [Planctomycetia bacterium]|nr:glycoside hydrolase family 38 C-terminal domain-containing protein [Planctomycetia bacterium]
MTLKPIFLFFFSLFLCLSVVLFAQEKPWIESWDVTPTSLVTRAEPAMQRAEITVVASRDSGPVFLTVSRNGKTLCETTLSPLGMGENHRFAMLPADLGAVDTLWTLRDGKGTLLAEKTVPWHLPRPWTIYVVSSTHCDIGLHNSQYIQRKMSSECYDQAMALVDQTKDWPDASRYRYMSEGVWFWSNYGQDRSEEAAKNVIENYVKKGLIGIGATCAGNHTQVYGFEELCRSAYTKRWLEERWNLDTDTMMMCDNNGMSWSIVAPYADAGIRNILFCPNQWNPLKSTIWPMDKTKISGTWNPDAGGGGSRVDVRYDSPLPMVFYWLGADEKSKMLVWCSTQYDHGGTAFGWHRSIQDSNVLTRCMGRQLAKLEKRYPYDVWLFANYGDDERPNLYNANKAKAWNAQWRYPEIRTVGDLSEPFRRLRETFDAHIPALRGDMTSGWSQHPICAPELLAQKFAADRLLPTAEKLASVASLVEENYRYPAEAFRRAWDMLIWNDEHSYGTSGYQGRRVYETWLQHRDWIEKAEKTAVEESQRALQTLAGKVRVAEDALLVFNPTLQPRREFLEGLEVDVPAFGYTTVPLSQRKTSAIAPVAHATPPVVENRFYKLKFAADGSISSLFDRELNRELLDPQAPYRCNQFVYTRDNHQTFTSSKDAKFQVLRGNGGQTVVVTLQDDATKADITQTVTLPDHEKRIDIDNQMFHVRDLVNTRRYYRYGYYAFPFNVPGGTFHAQLNGSIVEPQKDVTRHGTDAYLAVRDWSEVSNGTFGVALIQQDSNLVEFGKIHPDKTCFGEKIETSHLYSYLFTDWLQMHTTGGSFVNPRFRYVITSYAGDYRKGNVPQLAERVLHPVLTTPVSRQDGPLPASKSFLACDSASVAFLTLKAAEKPGTGYILRFWEQNGDAIPKVTFTQNLAKDATYSRCNVLERDREPLEKPELAFEKSAFVTLRLDTGKPVQEQALPTVPVSDAPAPIGSVYTGLVDRPRAVHGERVDQMYLEWGQNMEKDLDHYELYRSKTPGFTPSAETFLADVPPGEYRVGRYEDTKLEPFTRYYYRVRAVNKVGKKSPFSDEFMGITREP